MKHSIVRTVVIRPVVIRAVGLLATAGVAVGLVAVPAQAAGDRDCGDFSSQRAAQIFYLDNGGPRQDPHRLDDDGDGIACESNPGPYHYGSTAPTQQAATGGTTTTSSSTTVRVGYVVDGDTIALANGKRVRLIGIDTPERGRPYYKAAKRQLDRLVGTRVTLVNPASVDNQDRYGRLLRYLRLPDSRDPGLIQLCGPSARGTPHLVQSARLWAFDRHPAQPGLGRSRHTASTR